MMCLARYRIVLWSTPSFAYTQNGERVPVQRASSMVAELAPLLSWIEHLIMPGDILLIDEPEAHMHPEAVIAVAQTLVALAGSGVKVLCTTHSSEFLHQVSNCMLRSTMRSGADHGDGSGGAHDQGGVARGETSGRSQSRGVSISVEDIGVYCFKSDGDVASCGTRIVPVPIDPEWGIPEDEYVEVAERLAAETGDLVDGIL